MQCLNTSSCAPSVISPPCICAIGTLATIAEILAANISYLSPSTITMSGLVLLIYSLKLIIANPIAFEVATCESELSNISIFSSITMPSSSINLYVSPNSVDMCIPVTTNFKSISLSSIIFIINGFSNPYSALVPVITHILFTIELDHPFYNLF